MKINSALIGLGHFGKVHYKYLNKLKKINLKKICVKKNLKQKINNKKIEILTKNKKSIIDDKSIKFVDIVTPIENHASDVLKFLNADKDVLCEKPLILNNNQENKIKKIFLNKKNKLTISYPYLFSKSLLKMRNLIQKNNFGKIKFIKIQIMQSGRFNNFDVFTLLGPHAISILSIFINIKKVLFVKKNSYFNDKKSESGIIDCFIDGKFISSIDLSTNYINKFKEKKIIIYCSNGSLICDLNKVSNNLEAFIYFRTKQNSYSVSKITKSFKFTFNEKNNILHVINNAISNKNIDIKNFDLTLIINKFIKQKINYG